MKNSGRIRGTGKEGLASRVRKMALQIRRRPAARKTPEREAHGRPPLLPGAHRTTGFARMWWSALQHTDRRPARPVCRCRRSPPGETAAPRTYVCRFLCNRGEGHPRNGRRARRRGAVPRQRREPAVLRACDAKQAERIAPSWTGQDRRREFGRHLCSELCASGRPRVGINDPRVP